MNIEWKHIEWYVEKDVRYLRFWVSGKTGARWLIAKHECAEVLKRIQATHENIADMTLDELLELKLAQRVFRFKDGRKPFEQAGTDRTLYSLRHTYATQELLAGTDIHTLARQMGTSVVMLERHYSKLTATMAAEQLA
jgi:integrase